MELNNLTAISPLDGRYRQKVAELENYFSEFGLIRYRLMVEVEYFIALCDIPLPQLSDFRKDNYTPLRSFYEDFDVREAEKVKETEKITNHDVKAIEYYLKEKFFQCRMGKMVGVHPFRTYFAGYKQHCDTVVAEGCTY